MRHNFSMGPVRRPISLVVALTLAMAGCGGLFYLLFVATAWQGWMVMGTAMTGFLGLYWLWADFINADPRAEK